MTSFWRIFWLESVSLIRSKTLAMLAGASVLWMVALPYLLTGDGTAGGARELDLHYALGGVFALLVVSLLASATGSLAHERVAKRLQLTMVRPVRYAVLVLAKITALTTCGAVILALAAAILACRSNLNAPCRHVMRPVLPSVREEAKAMYKAYLEDPETPDAVKKAAPATILRLLENRAIDHYDTIPTNRCSTWRFGPAVVRSDAAVRMRFTNQFDVRQDVRGVFRLGGATGVVSNITQAVLTVPLVGESAGATELAFENRGKSALMFRPRKDLELLLAADAFGWNLIRTYLELVAVLALLLAFGLFLSAALSRPVALFVAIVTLLVSEMSPSVVEQCPEELEGPLTDRIGLAMTRFVADVTRPVSSLNPLARLAKDECIERDEVIRVLAIDLFAVPIGLALLAAFVLPRKQDEL